MNLTPVESSHIAAIGYLEVDRVLLVRYKDGALYAWPCVAPEAWEACQSAPSKGKFLGYYASLKGHAILISKGGGPEQIQSTRAVPLAGSGPLNSIDEDAGRCCQKALRDVQARDVDQFACHDCGLAFVAEMVGPVRHWRIVPQVVIVRRGQ